MRILVVNTGSSSVKCAAFDFDSAPPVEAQPPTWHAEISQPTVAEALASIPAMEVDVVGHRVVHGGDAYSTTVEIDDQVRKKIHELELFAPLHNKLNLEGIEAARRKYPAARHVAVFDTAFHRTIPDYASAYPLPYEYFEKHGIKRYGFHGINHHYCTLRAAAMLERKPTEVNLIICHLGNGCSVTTVLNGKSVDNTMGFTPLEGLMMGTRSGSLDPGIVLHLLRAKGLDADQIDELLNKKSGLLGVSGTSNDMRVLLSAAPYDERARLALNMFVFRLQAQIGAAAAHLGRVDALVYTAGIGENAALIRARGSEAIKDCLVDAQKNASAKPDTDVSSAASAIPVLVIRAREDWQIARECWQLK